jgi:hypothetical protein
MSAPADDPAPGARSGPADGTQPSATTLRRAGLPIDGRGLELIRHEAARPLAATVAAWATTVGPAVFARSSPVSARIVGLCALVAGLLGPLLPWRRLRPHVGLTLFIGLSTVAWLLSAVALQPARLDPARAAVGALAWGAFALAWSPPWPQRAAQPEAPSPELPPRASLPALAVPISALGILAAITGTSLAWRVPDPSRAILVHAAALACGVALVTVSASIAVSRGKTPPRAGRRFSPIAVRSLLVLATLLAAGAGYLLLR